MEKYRKFKNRIRKLFIIKQENDFIHYFDSLMDYNK